MTRHQIHKFYTNEYITAIRKKPNFTLTILDSLYITFSEQDKQRELLSNYTFWLLLCRQQYVGSILKLPTQLINMNVQDIVPSDLVLYMVHSARSIKWKRYYIMHGNEVIELLFLSLWLKNLRLFMGWLHQYFESANLKRHRRMFLLLNVIIGRLIWSNNLFLQLKGMRITLRGKFGKAGSVRKTRRYIRRGRCSYTTKKIAMISQTKVIRTLTGVFSIKFEVFFKKWCLH